MSEKITQNWHLDKRVPISIIVVLALQGGGFIWTFAELKNNVENNAKDISLLVRDIEIQERERDAENKALRSEISALRSEYAGQAVSLSRIEEQIKGLRRDLQNILKELE